MRKDLKGASSMVTKSSKKSTGAKRVKVKVPKLKLRKETLKDLSESDLKKIKGGLFQTQVKIYTKI